MNVQTLLTVERLCAGYGQAQALWDVSFSVGKGELVVLVGANGAGKTTTLRSVQGVLKPKSGRVTFGPGEITGLPANYVASMGLSLVP